MLKHKLVDFIIQFMEEVDKEISEMKLFVCVKEETMQSNAELTDLIAERESAIRCRVVLDPCEQIQAAVKQFANVYESSTEYGETKRDERRPSNEPQPEQCVRCSCWPSCSFRGRIIH